MLRPHAIAREYQTLIHLTDHAASVGPAAVVKLLAGEEWRALLQRGDERAEMVLLEALFERTRVRIAPQLPSQLDAVFAWGTVALAKRYCAEYHPSGVIHRCSLAAGTAIERDGAIVVSAFEDADLAQPQVRDLQLIEERAVRYWLAQEPMTLPEVLVHGRVVIEVVVESNEDARSG